MGCVKRLNAASIHFDVIGAAERNWIEEELPSLVVHGYDSAESAPGEDQLFSEDLPASEAATGSAQVDFVSSMRAVEAMFDASPQLFYRLDRYETLIGYPAQGEMGRLRDKLTGEIIFLPWPEPPSEP